MKYPIGIQSFETLIRGGYVYVDKTELIYNLAQEHVCFLSRPRRFGKSMLLSSLEAYFLGKKELFLGLAMEKLEKDWDVYPVFHIDFAHGNFRGRNSLTNILNTYLDNWERIYGKDEVRIELGDRFQYVLEQAYKKTGKKAVVLIDEYDKPLLDVLGEKEERDNRDILRAFYGTFKSTDASLRFVFLTGVTKFSQITVFSGFNQANDISLDSHYDSICGITESELYHTFTDPIKAMAKKSNCTEEEMKLILKKRYDGYHFSEEMLDIYNPFSLINAFHKNKLSDYWYQSGTPTYLVKLLDGHQVNLQKLTEKTYRPEYFVDYRADAENPLAMLYQSGYLTIKEYNPRYDKYKLDFPNEEVKNGFITLIANGYFSDSDTDLDNWLEHLDEMLRNGDLNGIRDAYTSFLASIPYEADKDLKALNYETHFQYTFYLINRLLSCYTTLIEKHNSSGRADVVIESINDIYIFEFKVDRTAKEALDQIDEKQYSLPYLTDQRKLHRIGVNISSETRTVNEWICI